MEHWRIEIYRTSCLNTLDKRYSLIVSIIFWVIPLLIIKRSTITERLSDLELEKEAE